MIKPDLQLKRRSFLRNLSAGAAFFAVPGLFAEELTQTPRQRFIECLSYPLRCFCSLCASVVNH